MNSQYSTAHSSANASNDPPICCSPTLSSLPLNPGSSYPQPTQPSAYNPSYLVQSNLHTSTIQPQMYAYAPVSPQGLQPRSAMLVQPLPSPFYVASPQTTSYPPYMARNPLDSSSEYVLNSNTSSPVPSTSHHQPRYPAESPFLSLPYPHPVAAHYNYASRPYNQLAPPPLHRTAFLPQYSPYYHHDGSTIESSSTWWYTSRSAALSPFNPTISPQFTQPINADYSDARSLTSDLCNEIPSPNILPMTLGHPSGVVASPSIDQGPPQLNYPELNSSQTPCDGRADQKWVALGRRTYHPNPPANRSEWVLWVGNIPSDATPSELQKFFNRYDEPEAGFIELEAPTLSSYHAADFSGGGVVSVFLISRSNCAFINFVTEEQLRFAADNFNGKALRPEDSRCPKLVCRIRRPDDDLKAGVGGQRGIRMHIKWIRERERQKKTMSVADIREPLASSSAKARCRPSLDFSLSSSRRLSLKSSASSDSSASTTSSFLAKHFPKRYFILKSLNEGDLKLSVERGVWATQHHNEAVLNQAYNSSQDVYLIFSANRSGEFFGYARMVGPIRSNAARLLWTARHDTTDESSGVQSFNPTEVEQGKLGELLTTDEDAGIPGVISSDCAEVSEKKKPFPHTEPSDKLSYLFHEPGSMDDLDAPPVISEASAQYGTHWSNRVNSSGGTRPAQQKETWGSPFYVKWMRIDKLSFQKTRHLRNPWNHGREIKVSRDGTELEPSVGEALLAQWEKSRDPSSFPDRIKIDN